MAKINTKLGNGMEVLSDPIGAQQFNFRHFINFFCSLIRKIRDEQLNLEREMLEKMCKNENVTVENARSKGDFEKLLAQVQQWKDAEVISNPIKLSSNHINCISHHFLDRTH